MEHPGTVAPRSRHAISQRDVHRLHLVGEFHELASHAKNVSDREAPIAYECEERERGSAGRRGTHHADDGNGPTKPPFGVHTKKKNEADEKTGHRPFRIPKARVHD